MIDLGITLLAAAIACVVGRPGGSTKEAPMIGCYRLPWSVSFLAIGGAALVQTARPVTPETYRRRCEAEAIRPGAVTQIGGH